MMPSMSIRSWLAGNRPKWAGWPSRIATEDHELVDRFRRLVAIGCPAAREFVEHADDAIQSIRAESQVDYRAKVLAELGQWGRVE